MSNFLKDRRALIVGGIISIGLAFVLAQLQGFYIITPKLVTVPVYYLINSLAVVLSWLFISFLIHQASVSKILGLLSILAISVGAEYFLPVRDNPITIPLMILFWLAAAYIVLPQFFKKYKVVILSVYGVVISYYFFVFITTSYQVENHRLSFAHIMLVPIPFFAILWIYEQWRWITTLKADKAKAELTLLKNQVDPHFFFNTLNNLYGLAVEKSDHAPAMILKLSDIMRYTIYDGRADYVSLEDEIAYLEDYIDLHKIRYRKQVNISFEKDLPYLHKIAPLLLIVPLENAFKHGAESQVEDAFIALSVRTTANSIHYQVSNNYELEVGRETGIGLENLRKRLNLIYPNKHQLEITSTADIYTVSLEITIP